MASSAEEARSLASYAGLRKDDFEAAEKAASQDADRWDGGKKNLRTASKAINALVLHAKKDVAEGKIPEEALEPVRRYIVRAMGVCDNLALKAEKNCTLAHGRAQGMRIAAKLMSEEIEDLTSTAERFENPPVTKHPRDRHPERESPLDRPRDYGGSQDDSQAPGEPQSSEGEDSPAEDTEGLQGTPVEPPVAELAVPQTQE